jgi:predicted nuclease of predicted toxin-antitoxin system
MKILLDENIDIRFKVLFPTAIHEVYTVRDMQWNGIKNGALLKLLQEHQFDCWIVVDKNIPYQQNISALPCLIIVLDVIRNTLKHISPLIPSVLDVLKDSTERKIIVIPEVAPGMS